MRIGKKWRSFNLYMINHKKTVIFDLDGTLIDSFDDVFCSMNFALKECGFDELNKEEIRQLIGPDLALSITEKVNSPHFSYDDFIANYRKYYTKKNTIHTALYPDVELVLKTLIDNDKQLAVLTNKSEDQSKQILSKLGVNHYFTMIAGPDTYNVAKPDPKGMVSLCDDLNVSCKDVVFIGDTEIDMITAQKADLTSVAVTYGYRSRDELKTYSPNYFIDTLPELLDLHS